MGASGGGNISVSMNMSLSAPFQVAGPRPLPRVGTCKNSNRDDRPVCWGLKFGQILFFLGGGGAGNWHYFLGVTSAFLGVRQNPELCFGYQH